MHRSVAPALPFALALLAAASPARAGAFDVQGFGPEGVAAVNARAARATDGTATFYNPGGLAFGRGVELSVAPTLGFSTLSAQHTRIPLDDPFGVALAFAATVPLEGPLHDRVRVGLGAYFLPTGVLHLLARPTEQPLFPYYDNRTQRLILLPALSVRLTDRLAIGVGANLLGGVNGPASVTPGASGAPESRIDVEANTIIALNAGIRFDLTDRVHLALSFRQRFAIPSLITTSAEVGGVPLDVTVKTDAALYDPTTIVLGSSMDFGRVTVELDASYAVWSAYSSPYVFVRASLPGLSLESNLPASVGRDVVSLRGAAAYRIAPWSDADIVFHAGAGFEPTMLKSFQQGRTNLLDGDKALFGLGAMMTIHDLGAARGKAPWLRALRFGGGFSVQDVLPYTQDKKVCAASPCPPSTVAGPDAANPGAGITNPGFPRLRGQGLFLTASLGLGVTL